MEPRSTCADFVSQFRPTARRNRSTNLRPAPLSRGQSDARTARSVPAIIGRPDFGDGATRPEFRPIICLYIKRAISDAPVPADFYYQLVGRQGNPLVYRWTVIAANDPCSCMLNGYTSASLGVPRMEMNSYPNVFDSSRFINLFFRSARLHDDSSPPMVIALPGISLYLDIVRRGGCFCTGVSALVTIRMKLPSCRSIFLGEIDWPSFIRRIYSSRAPGGRRTLDFMNPGANYRAAPWKRIVRRGRGRKARSHRERRIKRTRTAALRRRYQIGRAHV